MRSVIVHTAKTTTRVSDFVSLTVRTRTKSRTVNTQTHTGKLSENEAERTQAPIITSCATLVSLHLRPSMRKTRSIGYVLWAHLVLKRWDLISEMRFYVKIKH